MEKPKDQDRSKGATEQDSENEGGNTSMQGQLGHRDQDADIKDVDSDQPGEWPGLATSPSQPFIGSNEC
jgi:hypothetical protein